jgi:hypothetical protein
MAEAREIIKSRRPHELGDVPPYTVLPASDRVEDSKLKEHYTRAFHAFSSLELALRNEKKMPTNAPKMLRTYEKMMRARAETMARRRKSSNGVQQKSL